LQFSEYIWLRYTTPDKSWLRFTTPGKLWLRFTTPGKPTPLFSKGIYLVEHQGMKKN